MNGPQVKKKVKRQGPFIIGELSNIISVITSIFGSQMLAKGEVRQDVNGNHFQLPTALEERPGRCKRVSFHSWDSLKVEIK